MPAIGRRGPARMSAAMAERAARAREIRGFRAARGFGNAPRRAPFGNPKAMGELRKNISRVAGESRTLASMRARTELAAEELSNRRLWEEYAGRGFRQQIEEYEIMGRTARREQAEEARKLAKLEAEIRKRLLAQGKISPRLANIVGREIALALRENLGNERVTGQQLEALLGRTSMIIQGELRSPQLRQAMARNRQVFPQLIREASEVAMKEQGLIEEEAGE